MGLGPRACSVGMRDTRRIAVSVNGVRNETDGAR
jgi:hypothetical protein